jgi:hypothetical protein
MIIGKIWRDSVQQLKEKSGKNLEKAHFLYESLEKSSI